jgi:retinol dehydrogenase-14
LQGKNVLITGASSGIGWATAAELARRGATVILVCRSLQAGRSAIDRIRRGDGGDVHLLPADLSTCTAVRGLAREFLARFDRLDVLLNNAAVLTPRRQVTAEGLELQFAVNHLAPFLLTHLLLDALRWSAPARVVNVASTAHSRGVIDFEDLQGELRYAGWQTYANTKLANILFTYELARRLEGSGVTANCLHPGVVATGLVRRYRFLGAVMPLARPFLKSPQQGARTPVYLASSADVEGVTGRYFKDCQPIGTTPVSMDQELQRRLWEVSAKLAGLPAAGSRSSGTAP